MMHYSKKLTDEVERLDAEIRELENQMEISDDDLSRVVYRVLDIIDEEIRQVDVN